MRTRLPILIALAAGCLFATSAFAAPIPAAAGGSPEAAAGYEPARTEAPAAAFESVLLEEHRFEAQVTDRIVPGRPRPVLPASGFAAGDEPAQLRAASALMHALPAPASPSLVLPTRTEPLFVKGPPAFAQRPDANPRSRALAFRPLRN